MRHFPTLFLTICCSSLLAGQDIQKPDWVKLYQKGRALPDTLDCYSGIGSSSLTQEAADANARQEFALSIEARVRNVITRNVQEIDNVLKDEYSASAKISSEVVLRGITITGRYDDKDLKQYYALIQIRKAVFDTLLVTEIRRDLERRKEVKLSL